MAFTKVLLLSLAILQVVSAAAHHLPIKDQERPPRTLSLFGYGASPTQQPQQVQQQVAVEPQQQQQQQQFHNPRPFVYNVKYYQDITQSERFKDRVLQYTQPQVQAQATQQQPAQVVQAPLAAAPVVNVQVPQGQGQGQVQVQVPVQERHVGVVQPSPAVSTCPYDQSSRVLGGSVGVVPGVGVGVPFVGSSPVAAAGAVDQQKVVSTFPYAYQQFQLQPPQPYSIQHQSGTVLSSYPYGAVHQHTHHPYQHQHHQQQQQQQQQQPATPGNFIYSSPYLQAPSVVPAQAQPVVLPVYPQHQQQQQVQSHHHHPVQQQNVVGSSSSVGLGVDYPYYYYYPESYVYYVPVLPQHQQQSYSVVDNVVQHQQHPQQSQQVQREREQQQQQQQQQQKTQNQNQQQVQQRGEQQQKQQQQNKAKQQ